MKKFFLLIVIFFAVNAAEGSVVFIHGFLSDHKSMIPMKRAFNCAGLDLCLWDYPTREKNIRSHARDLCEILNHLAQNKPGEPIDFVAHSIGGLILRVAVNLPECPPEAKFGRAVLLAPPNRGSSLARRYRDSGLIRLAMGSKSGRELLNYTPADIENLGCFPETMQILVISGCKGNRLLFNEPNDGFLTLDETELDETHLHYVLRFTHGKLLTKPLSIKLTREFILNGYP